MKKIWKRHLGARKRIKDVEGASELSRKEGKPRNGEIISLVFMDNSHESEKDMIQASSIWGRAALS